MVFIDYDNFMYYRNVRVYEQPEENGDVGEYEVYMFNPYYSFYNYAPDYVSQYGMRQNGSSAPPTTPPPAYIPAKNEAGVKFAEPSTKAVDPGSIKGCLNRFVYIWQRNGRSYWAYLTHVGRKSISGWRWIGWRWVYFGVDLRKIDSFMCV